MLRRFTLAVGIAIAAILMAGTALAQPPPPCPNVFYDQPTFDAFCQSHGKFVKGVENFEEAQIPPGGKTCFPSPLGPDPNFPVFPNGLFVRNLIIRDNITPGPSPPIVQGSGSGCALYVVGAGFIGSNSVKVGEDLFLQNIIASIELFITEPHHTGVGFRLSRFQGYPTGGWIVTVYDFSNAIIGVFNVPPPTAGEPLKSFFGVWCENGIGRINIYDNAGVAAPDAIDDIELWEDLATAASATTWGKVKTIYR